METANAADSPLSHSGGAASPDSEDAESRSSSQPLDPAESSSFDITDEHVDEPAIDEGDSILAPIDNFDGESDQADSQAEDNFWSSTAAPKQPRHSKRRRWYRCLMPWTWRWPWSQW